MTPDLSARIDELDRSIAVPANNNAIFVGQFVADLVADGASLPDIERELRRARSRVFLIALPMTDDLAEQFTVYRPGDHDGVDGPRHYLWIAMNGPREASDTLRQHRLDPGANFQRLADTGFLAAREEEAAQRPSLREPAGLLDILEWLILDADNWTAARDTIRNDLALLTSPASFDILDDAIAGARAEGISSTRMEQLRDLLETARVRGPDAAFAASEFSVLEALRALLSAPTWEEAASVFTAYENELSGDLAGELLAKMRDDPKFASEERAVIQSHRAFLQEVRTSSLALAVEHAKATAPAKYGTPSRDSLVAAYLNAPDLAAAAEILLPFADQLLQVPVAQLAEHPLAQQHPSRFMERWGLLDLTREQGADRAYRVWAELDDFDHTSYTSDDERGRACERLLEIAGATRTAARERALELLLLLYEMLGRPADQLRVSRELLDSRSEVTRKGRVAYDHVNLGIVCCRVGDLREAERQFLTATPAVRGRGRPVRARPDLVQHGVLLPELPSADTRRDPLLSTVD